MPTKDFSRLYNIVTEEMYKQEQSLNDDQTEWMLSLVVWFWSEFRQWKSNSDCQQYLSTLNDRRIPREVQLAACVLLHIGYDLPRCIALSFSSEHSAYLKYDTTEKECFISISATPPDTVDRIVDSLDFCERVSQVERKPVHTLLSVLGHPRLSQPQNIHRNRYLHLHQLFRDLMTNPQLTEMFSGMSFLTRVFLFLRWRKSNSVPTDTLGILCNWMIALRTNAWVHGEMIVNELPSHRATVCDNLFRAVSAVREDAVKRCVDLNRGQWNPLFVLSKLAGLSALRPPELVLAIAILPLGVLAVLQPVLKVLPVLDEPQPVEAPFWQWTTHSTGIFLIAAALCLAAFLLLSRLARRRAIKDIISQMEYDFKFWLRHYRIVSEPEASERSKGERFPQSE